MKRKTRETNIKLSISKKKFPEIKTGIGFFNHMLEQFSFNSKFIFKIIAKGDLHVDQHHLIEDVGILLGKYFKSIATKALKRYSNAFVAMDESLTNFVVDISNRGNVFFNFKVKKNDIFDNLVYEFFKAFSYNSGFTIHIVNYGENIHHRVESIFKAFGLALNKNFKKYKSYKIKSTKLL
ncbi:imidazoleglycerol-phosphate dehydratase HisB [Candidatus Vidania fulgoroideorum]